MRVTITGSTWSQLIATQSYSTRISLSVTLRRNWPWYLHRKSAQGSLENMILRGRCRRPVDGGCHCFTILNVRFIKKCAVHHSICVNMLFLIRSWCVQERVTWLTSDFDMGVQTGKLYESSQVQTDSSRDPVPWRSFRNSSLADPGTRNGLHTLSLSNCRTPTARDLLRGWIPRLWTLRRRTNPIALNSGYFCSGGPKATDVANEAATRRSQEPSADVIRYLPFFSVT